MNASIPSGYDQLCGYLRVIHPGPISNTSALEGLLAGCLHEFENGDSERMHGGKLYGRMEAVCWEPPLLRFIIERHGGMALGSTRAERHEWVLDVERKTAECTLLGYRQVRPRLPTLKIEPIVEEIVDALQTKRADPRLKWHRTAQ
jgi:hypothetical protein